MLRLSKKVIPLCVVKAQKHPKIMLRLSKKVIPLCVVKAQKHPKIMLRLSKKVMPVNFIYFYLFLVF